MNLKSKFIIGVGALFALSAATSALAHEIGNGGGTWVCRETNGDIRWAKLVDIFEAQNEFGLTIATYPGSYTDIVDSVQLRLFKANRDLYQAVSDYLDKVDYLKNNPPQIVHTLTKLTKIDDALYSIEPEQESCSGGTIAYEQVVNYKNDGRILVQAKLFSGKNAGGNSNLSEVAKAALVYHEAIYAYRRETAGDKNSVMSRRIVGLIFSTLSVNELTKALETLGEGEVPITGQINDKSFAKIPAGSFMMGSPTSEPDRDPWGAGEAQHSVTIAKSFEMMKTEVTQSQWFAMMGNNPSSFAKYENCPKTYVSPEKNKGVALCPNNPVESVSWDDIQQFLVKLNQAKRDGYFYRLPTEAEWEYAARGCGIDENCEKKAYFWGSDSSQAFAYAWYDSSAAKMTHEVSSLKPNALGLYDTAGNVWEWVSDYYTADYEKYPNGGPSSGSSHVFRGGSWFNDAGYLRSASRSSLNASYRYNDVGFRLARQ